jgi:hypothetical protein
MEQQQLRSPALLGKGSLTQQQNGGQMQMQRDDHFAAKSIHY